MKFAPGLKSIDDAIEIRRRFLLAFEAAEREADPEARRAKLTFIVVGGGPTGVELAGTMSELARRAIPRDFRAIDTSTARVILVEAEDRLVGAFPPTSSAQAKIALEQLGVEVRLHSRVTEIDGEGVVIGPPDAAERINAENVFWAAGVQASRLGATLGAPIDKHGRVLVQSDLSIPDHPEVFVVGDLAKVIDPKSGHEVPGIAPAAIQMGKYVAKRIRRLADQQKLSAISHKPSAFGSQPSADESVADLDSVADSQRLTVNSVSRPFHYIDKGMLATTGRAQAVGVILGLQAH